MNGAEVVLIPAERQPSRPCDLSGIELRSIFANEIDSPQGKRTLHSAVLQRRYREGNEVKYKYTTSFGVSELPGALRALALAQQWIEARDLNGAESNSE